MESKSGPSKKPAISFKTLAGVVTTLGSQVKDTVTKVFGQKVGKSASPKDLEGQYENLLSPTQGKSNYGSVPSSSTSTSSYSYFVEKDSSHLKNGFRPEEKRLSLGSPLNVDNYFKEFADTLPTITVDKLSPSIRASYGSDKFLPLINAETSTDYLSVDTGDFKTPSPAATIIESTVSDYTEPDKFTWSRYLKIGIVVLIFFAAAVTITLTNENVDTYVQISASRDQPLAFPIGRFIPFSPAYPLLTISVSGAFATPELANTTNERMTLSVRATDKLTGESEIISEVWEVPIITGPLVTDLTLSHTFSLKNLSEIFLAHEDDDFSLLLETTTELSFPMFMSLKILPSYIENGALLGGLVIIGLYVLIIFELMNRTLSAMLAATVAIGILAAFRERPTTEELVSWLDMETLFLLFSMMVMVSILCETGIFNYCAFFMYKRTKGAIWPMITALCLFTAVVSAFLDNVTTILLMTPVTIRICEAMHLNPVPILIFTVVFSNIGGAATPVGDPPNAIIANDPDVIKEGIDFTAFVLHMTVGIIPITVVAYFQVRLMYRSLESLQFGEPYEIAELKREIDVWSRAVASLSSYSKDENDVKAILETKVLHLRSELKMKKKFGGQTAEGYQATLADLEETCRIKDWQLLIKCGIVLVLVIILFFIHSIPQLKLSMGWTALLGAVLMLTLADRKELDGILTRVEWSTLIFFSALFIVMEGVSRLGLLDYIGNQTEAVILHVNPDSRTIVAILIILWVSGLASAFIDNIPFTTMMIKIVTRLAASLNLPLQPLVWALAFGTCLGGNGTLIGASANVVCAGVADQHGYRFSFVDYFKIGFPVMIISLLIASVYLSICYYIGFF